MLRTILARFLQFYRQPGPDVPGIVYL